MSNIQRLGGTPVWNLLARNERLHARSAAERLRTCLAYHALSNSPGLDQRDILLNSPDKAIRNPRIRFDDKGTSFSVIHGKHKSFEIEITDSYSRRPKTIEELRELSNEWEDCMRDSTPPSLQKTFITNDKSITYPAVAAVCSYDQNWSSCKIRYDDTSDYTYIHITSSDVLHAVFSSIEIRSLRFDGVISSSLHKALLNSRSYVALHGSYSRRDHVTVKFGQKNEIRAKNDLEPLSMLRAIADALSHDWRLLRT